MSEDDVRRAAYLAGWRSGSSGGPYIGQPTTTEANAYDDGFERGRLRYRAVRETGVDLIAAAERSRHLRFPPPDAVAAAHAAGVAEERARWEARDLPGAEIAHRYGMIPGEHHKQWVIDQMLRALLGDAYPAWVEKMNSCPEHDPWDVGVAP